MTKQKRKFKRGEYRLSDTGYRILYALWITVVAVLSLLALIMYADSKYREDTTAVVAGVSSMFWVMLWAIHVAWVSDPDKVPVEDLSLVSVTLFLPTIIYKIVCKFVTQVMFEKVE